MSNLPYAGKRLLQMIPVLIGITMVTFLVIRLVPGNPALVMLGPKKATPETIAAINRQFGPGQSHDDSFSDGRSVVGVNARPSPNRAVVDNGGADDLSVKDL